MTCEDAVNTDPGLLLNKTDRIDEAGRAALMAKHPEVVFLSASSADDVAALRMTIIAFFESAMVEDRLTLPCAKQGLLGAVYANARVISEEVDANGRTLSQRSLPGGIARLREILSAC